MSLENLLTIDCAQQLENRSVVSIKVTMINISLYIYIFLLVCERVAINDEPTEDTETEHPTEQFPSTLWSLEWRVFFLVPTFTVLVHITAVKALFSAAAGSCF